jgi:ribosomal protein L7Ae-like RNA K-turn-binding protein
MAEFEEIIIDDKVVALFGLALKAKQLDTGMEAVKRSVMHQKIGLIFLSKTVGKDTLKKLMNLIKAYKVPVFLFEENELWTKLRGLQGYKIIGVRKGGFIKGFLQKIYSGV